MKLAKDLLLVYLLLKPFYLFGSGGLQVADLFLILAFITFYVTSRLYKKGREELAELVRKHKLFIIFVFLTIIINSTYYLFFPEPKFLLSSLYFVFNLLAILTFSGFISDRKFLTKVSSVFKFNLILQVILLLTGIGRHYDASRYMGTFNDPNQFAYYIFISFLFIYIINILLAKKDKNLIYFCILVFLTLMSASTGMLLGVTVFASLSAAYYIGQKMASPYNLLRKVTYLITIGAIIIIPVGTVAYISAVDNSYDFAAMVESSPITGRLNEKTAKAEGNSNFSLIEDRGYDTITNYPYYIIFGSGEGAYERFTLVVHNFGNEIHGTFPSILFYYGIIPFIILIRWLYKNIKGADKRILIVYVALFIESFSLINQRQALFWVIIILGGVHVGALVGKNKTRRRLVLPKLSVRGLS